MKKHLGLTQLRLVRWWVRLRNMQVFFLDLEFNLNLSLFALIATNLIDLHNENWWILTFVVVTFYVTIDVSSQIHILTIDAQEVRRESALLSLKPVTEDGKRWMFKHVYSWKTQKRKCNKMASWQEVRMMVMLMMVAGGENNFVAIVMAGGEERN